MNLAPARTGMGMLALLSLGIAVPWVHAGGAPQDHAGNDSYATMLGYLDNSRIDGRSFSGVSGTTAINMSAGDLNQQANLRAFAAGGNARASISSNQTHIDDRANAPQHAAATIGGAAFTNGGGLVSINQASGSGNAELNAIAAALAQQGIRETNDGSLSVTVSASARGQPSTRPHGPDNGTRSVAVESTAMKGFDGVLQLNQAAGSDNATSNQLLLAVPSNPR